MDASTRLVGLIGWPVRHSVSPAMHNAAFAALGINWAYVPLPVEPARVGEAVRGLRALGLRGANVTVPHKRAVLPYLDALAPAAQAIGAVNTIVVEPDGALLGDNTDAPGFATDLRAHGVEPRGKRVAVLGAGGSARAVVYALAEAGAATVLLLNRTLDRAVALADALQPLFPATPIAPQAWEAGLAAAAEADVVVNCTTLGMDPAPEGLPWDPARPLRPGQAVYDLVYNPRRTRLLAHAEAGSAQAIGGLGMLVWQGALALQRWTGCEPPVAVMRAAAEAVLAGAKS
jgi:shikimate dehydrogenase